MRADETREELKRVLELRPFQPFVLNFENGDRITLEHPENIAFDPTGVSNRLVINSGKLLVLSNLNAVTSVILEDVGQTVG